MIPRDDEITRFAFLFDRRLDISRFLIEGTAHELQKNFIIISKACSCWLLNKFGLKANHLSM